jgi:glycosyltransferase involved in cell wall biosynthesis
MTLAILSRNTNCGQLDFGDSQPVNNTVAASIFQRNVSATQILFIVDRPNWAHDFKTRNLMRLLGTAYDIRLRYQSEVTEEDIHEATLIVIYYWLQFNALQRVAPTLRRNRHKLLLGISSSYELEEDRRDRGLAVIHDFASGVFINSLLLYHEYQPLLKIPTFYTPNGVDTNFFCPNKSKAPSSVLRVGWAGSLKNVGPEYRGFHQFIVPAAASVDRVELLAAAREEKWRTPEEMREFYRALDVYVCASRNEGTPNPCLEAAACGVPLLTTCVGNMPELVRHGINGFFIERDVHDIARHLRTLRDDNNLRIAMSRTIQHDIQAWDWSLRSRAYGQMFEEMILKEGFRTRVAGARVRDSVAGSNNYPFRVVALISAYNEEDIIVPCLQYLIKQGLEVYLIDNWSTDSTVELAGEFLGKGLLAIEKFPKRRPSAHFVWKDILSRIEQLTAELEADWFVLQDVDEIRTSPWPGLSLRDAILKVDREGFNCIDHTVVTFHPLDNDFPAGGDFETYFRYFEFSDRPGQFIEVKAWKNLGRRISLSPSGGHEVRFDGRRMYPFRFLLKHYPIRSQAHGDKKIFRERKPRWLAEETAKGWHTHYDHIDKGHSFLRRPDDLQLFNALTDQTIVENGPPMIDWTAAHIKALESKPEKVLTLVNRELKKREELVHSVAVEVRRSKVEKKRLAFNQFTKLLAERDKNIQTLLDQIPKQQNTMESLADELTETHGILLRLVDLFADRPGPSDRKRTTGPLRLLYKKLKLTSLIHRSHR